MNTKENLFELRNTLRETMREADDLEQRKELMEIINSITNNINKLNEEDFEENLENMEALRDRINLSNQSIKREMHKLKDIQNKTEKVATVIATARDVVSYALSII